MQLSAVEKAPQVIPRGFKVQTELLDVESPVSVRGDLQVFGA